MLLARADGRLGPQLRPSIGDCVYGGAANPNGLPRCEDRFGPARLKARRTSFANITLDVLSQRLASQVGRKIVNRTGLSGAFDVDVEFNYAVPPLTAVPDQAPDGISLFAAMEDQLGLRLVSDRGPVEILVIDHAEHPVVD